MTTTDTTDRIAPKELILPKETATTSPAATNAVFISGAKIWFYDGTNYSLVTST